MRLVLVCVSVALIAVSGCDHANTLLAEDSPEAALRLVEKNAPEACIHPHVMRRLEKLSREETTPAVFAAHIIHEARRDVVKVNFSNQTIEASDNRNKKVLCSATLNASSNNLGTEAMISYEIRPVIGSKDITVITAGNISAPVNYVVEGSEDLIQARYNAINRQDAERRSTPLPADLRRAYLDTLDGCDRGSAPDTCKQMWEVLEGLEAQGWCQMRKSVDRLVEWHRCDTHSEGAYSH